MIKKKVQRITVLRSFVVLFLTITMFKCDYISGIYNPRFQLKIQKEAHTQSHCTNISPLLSNFLLPNPAFPVSKLFLQTGKKVVTVCSSL